MNKKIPNLLASLDLTELFKEVGQGNVKKWSAKRTFSGAVVAVALYDVQINGLSWMAVTLTAVAAVPLALSVWKQPCNNVSLPSENAKETALK